MKKQFLFVLLLVGFASGILSSALMAQNTDTETFQINAEIVVPLTITKDRDLSFGRIARAVTGDGDTVVSIAATDAGTRTLDSGNGALMAGATAPVVDGGQSAKFTVSGEAAMNFSITMASSATIQTGGGGAGETMSVNPIVVNGSMGTNGSTPGAARPLDGTGADTIYVGGTLTVTDTQVSGVYVLAAPHSITVTYD